MCLNETKNANADDDGGVGGGGGGFLCHIAPVSASAGRSLGVALQCLTNSVFWVSVSNLDYMYFPLKLEPIDFALVKHLKMVISIY